MKTLENIVVARTELRMAWERLGAFLSGSESAAGDELRVESARKLQSAIGSSLELVSDEAFTQALDQYCYFHSSEEG